MAVVTMVPPPYAAEVVSIKQLRAARSLLGWSQQDVADRSGVTLNTINSIERATVDPRKSTWDRIVRTYLDAGIVFIDAGSASLDGGEGVRLGKRS
jgi:predicted transcriptional regulator